MEGKKRLVGSKDEPPRSVALKVILLYNITFVGKITHTNAYVDFDKVIISKFSYPFTKSHNSEVRK